MLNILIIHTCTPTYTHTEGGRKLLEVMVKFMTLFIVMASQVYAYLQTHQDVHIKYAQLFCMSIMPQ